MGDLHRGPAVAPVGVYDFATYRAVSDGYFETLGMPLLRGRTFTAADTEDAPLAIVINQAMARAYWGDQIPWDSGSGSAGPGCGPWSAWSATSATPARRRTAVGVYLPFGQARNVETAPSLVVRTAIDAAAMTSTVRAAVTPSIRWCRSTASGRWSSWSPPRPVSRDSGRSCWRPCRCWRWRWPRSASTV